MKVKFRHPNNKTSTFLFLDVHNKEATLNLETQSTQHD